MLLALVVSACLTLPAHSHIVDPFRAPPCDRCAGNRGLDLAVTAGQSVSAGLDGIVWFAGQVGGRNYVVVRAARNRRMRVTYGGLASIDVVKGQRLARGTSLGTSADALFFGVRIGDRYVDPLSLVARTSPSGFGPDSRDTDATAATDSRPSAVPRFRLTLGPAHHSLCAS